MTRYSGCALIWSMLTLSGCASFSQDGGFEPVMTEVKQRLNKEVSWSRTAEQRLAIVKQVDTLLARPLDEETAVQIALLNNRGLQAAYQALGISESQLVQAGTLPNPGFSFGKFRRGDEREIERNFHFDIAKIFFMPVLKAIARDEMASTQASVTSRVMSVAAETRKAFYEAVATGERLRYMKEVSKTAQTGALLAKRMALIGNLNKVDQAREQGFYADAVVNLTKAIRANHQAREKLIRLLGVWGDKAQLILPERLPDLPDAARDLPNAERTAMTQRLDLVSARLQIEQMAKTLGLKKVNRFVNVLEVGYERETSNDAPRRTGYEIGFEIPIFNFSGAKTRMAEASYMQAVHLAADSAINARSEVREAYMGYRAAYDIARLYQDEIVPTRKRLSEENLYRYNGMIIGVFELLADARAQIAAVDGAIQAVRDFWVAKADLDMAMIGKPSFAPVGAPLLATGDDAGGGH